MKTAIHWSLWTCFVCSTLLVSIESCWSQVGNLTGTVTSATTGSPLVGAKITVGMTYTTYSTGPSGTFLMSGLPPGTYTATCTYPGFDNCVSGPFLILPNSTITSNCGLLENCNPPGDVNAFVNISQTAVTIFWDPPTGIYQLSYDDGIPENFALWADSTNLNATKFTPAGYPCTCTGVNLHVGSSNNYPGGILPAVPFQIFIYDASGPGGTPGLPVAGPFVFTPASFGWNHIQFPTPVEITAGDFYIVHRQGGNAPNAIGLAVDTTLNQNRSYQRFVTTSGSWVQTGRNFLIRAEMNGPNGPVPLLEAPQSATGYQVWRLLQGQESNPASWVNMGTTTAPPMVDNSWPTLPCKPYAWAVKAQYPGNRWSNAVFSNVIGKCWTAVVTIHISLTCTADSAEYTQVILTNLTYPDTVYSKTPDSTGTIVFPSVWMGTYSLSVNRFGYIPYTLNALSIMADDTIAVLLSKFKRAPSNLQIHDRTLKAVWSAPRNLSALLSENWLGGLSQNGWTITGGTNWQVTSSYGNSAPCAMFNWSPQVFSYDQYLTSKTFSHPDSPSLKVQYDISLSAFGTTLSNSMAVELWDGTVWHVLHVYSNANGNIPWTTTTHDISAYSHLNFKIRFHAEGVDSYDLNYWLIDNVIIVAHDSQVGMNPCVLGYNLYLNGTMAAFINDTTYTLPCTMVNYGQSYNLCLDAFYENGYSTALCTQFISHFLNPPVELSAEGIDDAVYLQWQKPICNGVIPPGLLGYKIYRAYGSYGSYALIKQLTPYPDSLSWYDTNLDIGDYCYKITAVYDLSFYGLPGQFDESIFSSVGCATVTYGNQLPACEDWTAGTFVFNDWEFGPEGQGNWSINPSLGNTEPSSEFFWQPPLANYNYSLVSQVIDASGWTCATVWLDFDYKLVNQVASSTEKLTLELFYNNTWHVVTEFVNSGNVDWSNQHLDISDIKGKAFRYRFRANGLQTNNIQQWNIDNLCVYGVGKKPNNFEAHLQGFNVHLSWNAPQCGQSSNVTWFIFDNGTMENGWAINSGNNAWIGNEFPLASTTQGEIIAIKYMFWDNPSAGNDQLTVDFFDGAHNLIGTSSPFIPSDNSWDSVSINNIPFTGSFYALVHWNNAVNPTNWLGYDENGPYSSYDLETYFDGTTWDKLTNAAGANPGVCLLRVKANLSGDKQIILPTADSIPGKVPKETSLTSHGPGSFGIVDHAWTNSFPDHEVDSSILMGYNVYRTEGYQGNGAFYPVNSSLIPAENYTDLLPTNINWGDVFKYYVGALFFNNSDSLPVFESVSDTIGIEIVSGLNERVNGLVKVYPNPASDYLTIESDNLIYSIELSNLVGQVILYEDQLSCFKRVLNSRLLPKGLFILRVLTKSGIYEEKLILTD